MENMMVSVFLLFGLCFSTTMGSPAYTTMVNYDDETTFPPFINYKGNFPRSNIIHLRHDEKFQAELLAREPTRLVERSLYLNRDSTDDYATSHANDARSDGLDRVVNGTHEVLGNLPVKAKLSLYFDEGVFFCGSTIIHEQWLLTAAHCITSDTGNLLGVMARAGSLAYYEGGQTVFASLVIPHPDYTTDYGSVPSGYDIALLKLASPLTFDDYVDKALLSSPPNPEPSTQLTIAGWGLTEEGGLSSTLKSALVTTATCPSNNFGLPNFPTGESLVCVLTGTGHSCKGDSGGFVGRRKCDGTYTVDAVVSFGPFDPNTGVCPDGYSGHTRVSFYQDWINDTINNN